MSSAFGWPKRVLAAAALAFSLSGLAVAADAVEEAIALNVDGKLPDAGAEATASGSGVIIGPGLILTNRHVAADEDDDNKPRPGFFVYVGPDYKKKYPGRVAWICKNYDLAIIQTDTAIDAGKLMVLDGLAPLGSKVTAFGFPLGSKFGVGLTATGGQVTRHPVGAKLDEDDAEIRRSMWHDAVTTGGSSGGPLLDQAGVLVGVHFGSLKSVNGHGLAIPGYAVASFLRQSKADNGVKFARTDSAFASEAKSGDLTKFAVYIEATGRTSGDDGQKALANAAKGARRIAIEQIKQSLRDLSAADLQKVASGDIAPAFKKTSASNIEARSVVRIAGNMTIIQILADGSLVEIDGVRCFILFPHGEGGGNCARKSVTRSFMTYRWTASTSLVRQLSTKRKPAAQASTFRFCRRPTSW